MPIPGSRLNTANIQVSNLFIVENSNGTDVAYPSLATFLQDTLATTADGQETHVPFVAIDANHTNVPCRKAVIRSTRPEIQVGSSQGIETEDENYQVTLDKYIDDISLKWQIQVTTGVDTAIYQIRAVEHSGGNLNTRVMASELDPYNA